jgi:hypothetical protein
MLYHISRDGQQFGPYSLADLQRYLASGNILPTDLARSEGMEDWVPVQTVVGNVPVANPAPAPPQTYGQLPAYAAEGVAAPAAQEVPLPPDLHWGLLLLLEIVTCGLFAYIWMFIQAAVAKRLDPKSNAIVYYAIGIATIFACVFMSTQPNLRTVAGLVELGALVLVIAGHFSIKSSLEDYFTRTVPLHLSLSGVMTFFFNSIYFQYHFNRIQRWKQTGVLS